MVQINLWVTILHHRKAIIMYAWNNLTFKETFLHLYGYANYSTCIWGQIITTLVESILTVHLTYISIAPPFGLSFPWDKCSPVQWSLISGLEEGIALCWFLSSMLAHTDSSEFVSNQFSTYLHCPAVLRGLLNQHLRTEMPLFGNEWSILSTVMDVQPGKHCTFIVQKTLSPYIGAKDGWYNGQPGMLSSSVISLSCVAGKWAWAEKWKKINVTLCV